jgi:hypothetical protein
MEFAWKVARIMTVERRQVLWIGPRPRKNVVAEFERRHLSIKEPKDTVSDRDFAVSCAVIFCFDEKNKGHSIGQVKQYAAKAANHGAFVIIHAHDEAEIKTLQAHMLKFPEVNARFPDFPRPIKYFSVDRPAYELAELAARHPTGPAYNPDLDIKGTPPAKESDVFLLKRAFSDCRTITVEPLTKGFSGARVLAVFAEFPEGEVAPYPLPYFAKIDTCQHILKEYEAYDRFVTRFVPFSQRPNCEPKRCLLGLDDGILVGDFVDDSVSLAEIIQPNGARAIMHSLFDDALRGWRQQAYRRNERMPLSDIRERILDPRRIKAAHLATAKTFGSSLEASDITRLLDDSAQHSYRRGPMHGDLNTQNIRVRHGEAVLIDFYKSDIGPLAADLASLEVAICFSLEADTQWDEIKHGSYLQSDRFIEWRRHIDSLFVFKPGEFGMVPPLQEQPCVHDWMWSACRQLRLMAHYLEPSEDAYACLLAAYLLRMAMFPDDDNKIEVSSPDAIVRGYAYYSAERILSAMKRHKEAA